MLQPVEVRPEYIRQLHDGLPRSCVRARTLPTQKTEAKIGCNVLNRMTRLGMLVSVRAASDNREWRDAAHSLCMPGRERRIARPETASVRLALSARRSWLLPASGRNP